MGWSLHYSYPFPCIILRKFIFCWQKMLFQLCTLLTFSLLEKSSRKTNLSVNHAIEARSKEYGNLRWTLRAHIIPFIYGIKVLNHPHCWLGKSPMFDLDSWWRSTLTLYCRVVKQAVKVNQTVSVCETDTKCIEWCIPEMAGQTFTSAQFKVSVCMMSYQSCVPISPRAFCCILSWAHLYMLC